MSCLPFLFGRSKIEIEVRLEPQDYLRLNIDPLREQGSVVITVLEEENLTFGYLEQEAFLQLLGLSNSKSQLYRQQLKPFGLKDRNGKFVKKKALIWNVCADPYIPFIPSFTMVFDGLLHLISDSTLIYCASFLGFSPKTNAVLMSCSVRFKRVFSSNEVWHDCELNFPFMGICSGGPNSYLEWLYKDQALPRYDALRVLRVALLSSRLRIYFGTLSQRSFPQKLMGSEDKRKNLVVFISIDDSGPSLYQYMHLLLPDSSICGTSACILKSDYTQRLEKMGNHWCRVQVAADSPGLNPVRALGDDRMQFLLLKHSDGHNRFQPILNRTQAFALCIKSYIDPNMLKHNEGNISSNNDTAQLKTLYQAYCRGNISPNTTSDTLASNACPIVIFVMICDVDICPPSALKETIAIHMERINDEMKNIVIEGKRQGCFTREWLIQPCTENHGLIAGVNYLIRSSTTLS
jgi:hypothetical protein